MNEYTKFTLTELYEKRSMAQDIGEIELVSELQAAIRYKTAISELFFKAIEPQLVSRRKRSGKRKSQ